MALRHCQEIQLTFSRWLCKAEAEELSLYWSVGGVRSARASWLDGDGVKGGTQAAIIAYHYYVEEYESFTCLWFIYGRVKIQFNEIFYLPYENTELAGMINKLFTSIFQN